MGFRGLVSAFRAPNSPYAYPRPPYLCPVKILRQNALLLALAAAALAACSSPNKPISENGAPSEVSAAEMKLLNQHDTLMAKTQKLYELKTKLSSSHTEAAAPYIHGLLAADAAMMAWMHQYKAPDTTAAPATRLAYFQQQQQMLDAVGKQYTAALDSAIRYRTEHPGAGEVQPTTK